MSDQLALITGASSGIGEAYARQLAAQGYDLCITGRRRDKLDAIAADLQTRHKIAVHVIAADLSAADGIARHEEWIRSNAPRLLINNAGFGARGLFATRDISRYLEMINVHVIAAVRLTSAALPAMLESKQGGIINVSSITAYLPLAGNTVYSGTKSFLVSFTQALSYELKNSGIKTQVLIPGFTYSDFHKRPDYARVNTYTSVPKFFWMDADEVVRISLRDFDRGRLVCVPGLLNKMIVLAGRSGLAALGSSVMAGIYKRASRKDRSNQ